MQRYIIFTCTPAEGKEIAHETIKDYKTGNQPGNSFLGQVPAGNWKSRPDYCR